MHFSEVFLRIGSALVAWMVLFAYFIWIAVIQKAGCGDNGAEIHRLLLGMAPVAVGAAFALRVTRPFADIHRLLRWLGLTTILMMFLVLPALWRAFSFINLNGEAICAGAERLTWHVAWAPIQIVAVCVCIGMVVTEWRAASVDISEAAGQ